MPFVARTPSPTEWKAVAATISTLVEEASFEATAEGLTFRAMDPSHVALVDLFWPSSAFEKYTCDKQQKFAVRVEDFVKLIRRADSRDAVEVSMVDDDTLLLKLANGYRREFSLHLIESTAGATPLPKLTFNSRLLITEPTFEKILNDISTVSDHLTVEADRERVVFAGKSDAGNARITLEKGNQDLLELEVKEASKATFTIDYLVNIAKAAGTASDTILAEYSSKMPLRLEFKLAQQGGRIHFYLAPRIEER